MCTPLNDAFDMPFTFVELQKAKDVLDACEFVSPSTKSCYSSRIAMWIHYCNMYCRGDDHVTESRLSDYVEWMVSSGAAERIRQGVTHLQQVLRNQLQGVLCYWRIQNGGRTNISDPRLGAIFIEKWQQIAMRFPRPRQARRTEPIYGTNKPHGGAPNENIKQHVPGMIPHVNQIGGIPYGNQGNGMRMQHLVPRDHVGHPAGLVTSIAPSAGPIPHNISTVPGAPHTGYTQGIPPTQQQFPPGPVSDARIYEQQPYPRSQYYTDRDARYPQDMRLPQPYSHQQKLAPTPTQPEQTLQPRAPVTRLGLSPSRNLSGFTSGPSYPSAMNVPRPIAPLTKNDSYHMKPASRPPIEQLSIPGDVQQAHSLNSRQDQHSDGPLPSNIQRHLPDDTRSLSAMPGGESPQLELTAVSAPSSPVLAINMVDEIEQALEGVLPDTLPEWNRNIANASMTASEGHLLNINEEIALSIQQLGNVADRHIQSRAHHALGMNTWMPVSKRNSLTLADFSIEELPPGESEIPAEQESKADEISEQGLHVEQAPKVLAIAMRPESEDLSNFVDDKTVVLRHINPLLCSWSALAMLLFARWHISNEAAPDFSNTEWQSQRLFQWGTDKPSAEENDNIANLFASAMSKVSNDKIDDTKAMSECGFFYADAFSLVKPTAAGIKGLDTVDTIDAAVLQPSVLAALVRVNAGYNVDASKAMEQPKRVNVKPPQSLLKEVFPWLKTALIDAFRQNKNNEDVHAARRILQVLRELRVVLLQDVAFMMVVPSLADTVKNSTLFNHALFKSAGFLAFREDMSKAVAESEVKHIDSLCAKSLEWTSERKQKQPKGGPVRMNPTASRLPGSAIAIERPVSMADNLENGHKRQREPSIPVPAVTLHEQAPGSTELDMPTKRTRLVYDALASSSTGRIFSDISASTQPAKSPAEATTDAPAEAVSGEMAKMMDKMRSENEDLKAQLRRMEWALSQHKTEVRAWMSKIEKGIQGASVSVKRPLTPPPTSESVPQHYAGTAAPGYSEVDTPARPQHIQSSTRPSPALPQQLTVHDNQFRILPKPNGEGMRQVGLSSETHSSNTSYKRQLYPKSIHGSPAGALRPTNQETMAEYRPPEYRTTDYRAVDYRSADQHSSPRAQGYVPRATPQMDYTAPRYPPQYGGDTLPRQQEQPNGYNYSERSAYASPYNGVYPSKQTSP
ncbi:hypothetical protein COEREDRAFT_89621 [Coemansia reversa NRRL 1564]|uniref:Ndc10 domain-containing protein n=1 Tax=Coemansia reversa (strain ATCC 12441 / NRRL 1564) TaxID=763665 RepID=A0A2G5B313_COERN|nr:hypothetical protein COEREDRAFT_89621 [Coemansia reversa NRRL 1564]|eukprot:PIA13419.1 hypothetical protein COEREDRAFT_89621 [Coemansia reversa NRRL 1564]